MNAASPAAGIRMLALAALGAALPGAGQRPEVDGETLRLGLQALRAAPAPGDAALVRMADRLGLDDAELLVVALLVAVETDAALARAVAAAQAPMAGSQATLGLLAAAAAPVGGTVAGLGFGRAVMTGLLVLGDEPAALPERTAAAHGPTVACLTGYDAAWDAAVPLPAGTLPLPPGWLDEAAAWAAALGCGGGLAVRAASLREARAVIAVVGPAVTVTAAPPGLAPWLHATGRAPMWEAQLGPGERWSRPPVPGWDGPWFVAVEGEGAVDAPDLQGEWMLPIPPPGERAGLWEAAGLPRPLALRAGHAFRQGPARIADAGARARAAGVRRGVAAGWTEVAAALHDRAGPLDALARRVTGPVGPGALVLDGAQQAALDALAGRCRLRETLGEGLGPAVAARYRPGVRALLHGPSGTGKTLAASWLAGALGLPLHRVDLAALTSKWIGETEKNLAAVLAAAEHADVVLFFDEADALFAARSDGGEANDRFANAQTNYLLQRIESFDGVALLASNAKDRFDPAFLRRLDAVIAFDPPDAAARRLLWSAHLGAGHAIGEAALDRLAVTVELPGGHIRNVVLAAAARARMAGQPLGWAQIAAAVAEEHAKLGRAPPAGLD